MVQYVGVRLKYKNDCPMSLSWSTHRTHTCPYCGASFSNEVWFILDAQEQVEQTALLYQGLLNRIICPICTQTSAAQTPLLFHDSMARCVLFVIPPGVEEYRWREQVRELHTTLVDHIPREQHDTYVHDVQIVQDMANVAHVLKKRARWQPSESRIVASGEGDVLPNKSAPAGTPSRASSHVSSAGRNPSARISTILSRVDQQVAAHPEMQRTVTRERVGRQATVQDSQQPILREKVAPIPMEPQPVDYVREATTRESPSAQGSPSGVLTTIYALLRATSMEEFHALVEREPVLLEPETDRVVVDIAHMAFDQREYAFAEALTHVRHMLLHMKAGGNEQSVLQSQPVSEAGFASEPAPLQRVPERVEDTEETEDTEDAAGIIEDAAGSIEDAAGIEVFGLVEDTGFMAQEPLPHDAYQALMQAQSSDALLLAIQTYPLLLEPWVDDLLLHAIEEVLGNGYERLALFIEFRRELLIEVCEIMYNQQE